MTNSKYLMSEYENYLKMNKNIIPLSPHSQLMNSDISSNQNTALKLTLERPSGFQEHSFSFITYMKNSLF